MYTMAIAPKVLSPLNKACILGITVDELAGVHVSIDCKLSDDSKSIV